MRSWTDWLTTIFAIFSKPTEQTFVREAAKSYQKQRSAFIVLLLAFIFQQIIGGFVIDAPINAFSFLLVILVAPLPFFFNAFLNNAIYRKQSRHKVDYIDEMLYLLVSIALPLLILGGLAILLPPELRNPVSWGLLVVRFLFSVLATKAVFKLNFAKAFIVHGLGNLLSQMIALCAAAFVFGMTGVPFNLWDL